MNARLQVEHPVTELVTGLDLVELQLRVAGGRAARRRRRAARPRDRGAHQRRGRAVLPVGRAGRCWRATRTACASTPRSRPARVVGTDYDSMIAKVIAHGPDRATALARLDRALADTAILGLTTNVGFLRSLLARDDVRAGEMDTGLIGRLDPVAPPLDRRGGRRAPAPPRCARRARAGDDPFDRRDGWRLGGVRAPSYWKLAVDGGEPLDVVLERSEPRRRPVHACARTAWLGYEGWTWHVTEATAEDVHHAHADGELRAPMPGSVLLVRGAVGDAVEAGQTVVVLESMKMELALDGARRRHRDRADRRRGRQGRRATQIVARVEAA